MNSILVIFFLSYGLYSFFNNFKFWIIYIIFISIYCIVKKYIQKNDNNNKNISNKINASAWPNIHDPDTYTTIKLDITKIVPYLKKKSEEIKENITPTIFAIKLMAIILKKYPEIYGYIKFGRYNTKDGIDIGCIVQVGEGSELASTTVANCEKKSFKDIIKEFKDKVNTLRARKNRSQNLKMFLFKIIPTFLAGPTTQVVSYLSSIGLGVKLVGLKRFEFGSFVITSIGGLGIEHCYANIPPFTFVPLLLALCKKNTVNKKMENGNIETKTYLKMNFNADYRFFSLKNAVSMFNDIHLYGENPERFEEECKKYANEI